MTLLRPRAAERPRVGHLRDQLAEMPTLGPGLALLLFVLVLSGAGAVTDLAPRIQIQAGPVNAPPSLAFLLGTQREGRDVLALLMVGTPNTLRVGLIAGLIGLLVGTFLGLAAGYVGGRLDLAVRSLIDAGLTIPPLAILILIAATFRVVTIEAMGLVVAVTAWMYPARVIRSQALSLREHGFVQVAKLSGAGPAYIVFREILPNLIPFLSAVFVGAVSNAMLVSIGLEILGLGSQRDITLGSTLYSAILNAAMFRGIWWWWLPPIMMMVIIFLGLFLVSVALDAYADPRRRAR